MAEEVAKAYIQLIPSASGIKGAITKELGGDVVSAGALAGGKFSKAFGGALAGLGKIVTGAVAAGAAAAGKLAKDAVEGFADYEQLVGGVETLFKGSADTVQKYAAEAFKTAGLSANEYMETVTGFSASLIQSLGGDTAKAAEVADMAITDMSDNANKMGTSMESIQNAYQGFAKQNFTMLDNLKLGYGGTKEEMQRMLEDAERLSGIKYDVSSYADIVEAIHVIQTELGITGTTAKEASETISGSVAAMKSAWDNLVIGLADDDADLDALIDNLVESAETAAGNILPVVEKALGGIAELVEKLAPVIADKLPALATAILPPLIEAAASIVQGLAAALPDILAVLIEIAPDIIDTIIETAIGLLPQIVELGLELIVALAGGITESLPELIPSVVEVILQIVDTLTEPETLVPLIAAALQIIIALADGILKALPKLLEKGPEIVVNLAASIIESIPFIVAAAVDLMLGFINGLMDFRGELGATGGRLMEALGDEIDDAVSGATQWGRDLIQNFLDGIKAKWDDLKSTLLQTAQSIANYLGFSEPELGPLSNFHTFAPDMMELFAEGIRENMGLVTSAIDGAFDIGPRIVDYGIAGAQTGILASDSGAAALNTTPSGFGGEIVFNVTETIDGQVLARNQYRFNLSESNRVGNHAVH